MSGVADEQDRVALGRVPPRLGVHLRDERAGRVDRPEPALRRALAHGRRDPVRREDEQRAERRVLLALDEDGAAALEVADDVRVVDDLLADVDRRAVQLERPLDRLDGPFDPGAVPAGRCEHQLPHHAQGSSEP